jgi:hypothetical protein
MARNTRLRIAQVLLIGPLGALVVGAAFVFSLVSPPEPVQGIDWAVAAWAVLSGSANLLAGLRLHSDWPASRRLALAACTNYAAFSLVKLIGYGEAAAVPFLIGIALVAALVGVRASTAAKMPRPWATSSDTA